MAPRSRLNRTQTRRSTRQAVLFFSLTILLILAILFFGIPLLVKGASFLIDLRSANTPTKTTATTAPPPPQLFPTLEATNSATINLTGFSQSGSEITLFQNSNSIKTLVTDDQGNFSFTTVTLEPGENRFWTSAKNSPGQESQISNQLAITFDQEPPKLEITSPQDSAKFFGNLDKTITIQGKTEPNASLYLNDRLVNVSSNGDFSYKLTLTEGENRLHFQATDLAGNVTQTDLTVSYAP